MHQIHTGRAPQYLAHSMQLIAESSRRPGMRSADTADYTSNVALVLNLVNVASAALNSLPDNIKLTNDTIAFWHLLAPLDIL